MQTRKNALNEWITHGLGIVDFELSPLAVDASFRRYFRLQTKGQSRIIMDAPPEKETILPVITVTQLLASQGVHVPLIYAQDKGQGFLLLEDLGDTLLLHQLQDGNEQKLYSAALSTLCQLQQCSADGLPAFDEMFIQHELSLFKSWFLEGLLASPPTSTENNLLDQSFQWITDQILQQPRVFIHRDYHSRNIMLVSNTSPPDLGIIDFQDAMSGPFTYDAVSLLKDCYIQWPRQRVHQWLAAFHAQLPHHHGWDLQQFTHGFDVCGLQRHLKVLGVFSRLHLRDNKSTYLRHLPLVFNYILTCLEDYPELGSLHALIQEKALQVSTLFVGDLV